MKWEVQIAGSKTDLDDLCDVFKSDALKLENQNGSYFLSSTEFSSLTDHREVESRASGLVSILSGASKLSLGTRTSLKVGGITRIDENGQRNSFLSLSDGAHVTARLTLEVLHADGTTTRVLPASLAPGWVAFAISNSAAAKALRLFGAGGESWVELYRILEVIIQDVGGITELAKRGWVTESKIETFKHTANSIAATGDDARHGAEHTSPPSNPMSLSEAKSLVSVLLHSWLQEKANVSPSAS